MEKLKKINWRFVYYVLVILLGVSYLLLTYVGCSDMFAVPLMIGMFIVFLCLKREDFRAYFLAELFFVVLALKVISIIAPTIDVKGVFIVLGFFNLIALNMIKRLKMEFIKFCNF